MNFYSLEKFDHSFFLRSQPYEQLVARDETVRRFMDLGFSNWARMNLT